LNGGVPTDELAGFTIPAGLIGYRRKSPVIFEATSWLHHSGWKSAILRYNPEFPFDIIAWSDQGLLFIIVRRTRRALNLKQIGKTFGHLCLMIKGIEKPAISEVQLWLNYQNLFTRYTILAGGFTPAWRLQ
jgi:hypothetical protein